MQLPYPAPLPGWTKHAHPCIVSRPFSTVHSNIMHRIPRLYPIQLASRYVIPSDINSLDAPKSKLLHHGDECNRVTVPMSQCVTEWHNNMCSLPFDSNKDTVLAGTSSGTFGDIALWQIGLDESGTTDYFTPLPTPNSGAQFPNRAQETVKAMSAAKKDSNGGVLAACCSKCVCVGRYDDAGTYLNWVGLIDIQNALDVDLNPISQNEIVILDRSAIQVFDLVQGTANCLFQADFQPLAPHAAYRWVHYAAHPRTLLTSSRRHVARVDLRCDSDSILDNTIVKPHTAWNLPSIDQGISFFTPHPSHPFRSILTTDSLLAVIDSRMTNTPLLEWNLSLNDDFPAVSVAALNTGPDADFVIAVSSRVFRNLFVFHATSCLSPNETVFSVLGDLETRSSEERLFQTQPVWSDMPLAHLDQFMPGLDNRGLALVPHPGGSRISLVQSSTRKGMMTQLLGCETFNDGSFRFEPQSRSEAREQHLLHGVDSAVNVLNSRDSIIASSSIDLQRARDKLLKDFEPGNRILENLSCMDARDSLAARDSVLNS